ncbi:MAG TPA: 30S ribosomal protein S1 [Candidatus Omnitrophota bacterium]|nr:30S ribosomal protein S1 [Candidatus Omnitrophota bacterium]
MILKEKQTEARTKAEYEPNLSLESEPMTDFSKLYAETIKSFAEGEIVKGKVVSISGKEALVDIGYKSEGLLNLDELPDPSAIKVGDEIEVLFEYHEDEEGMVIVSKRKADRQRCWNKILSTTSEGSIVEGRICKRVPGGFMVDIGMEAFLPASLVDLRPTRNLDQFSGLVSKFKIVKINPKRKNIVLSRKDYLELEKDELRAKKLGELKEGAVVKGRVKNITDFGVFIDLSGVDGLLHITDMSWGRINHPSELVKIGDEIEVMVTAFDKETQRISLGMKQLAQDPWHQADVKYPANSRIKGKVVNLLPYGAFVELEKGIEGLVHVSELSWTKRFHHPSEVLSLGQEVEAVVLSVDKDSRKIALGIKQLEGSPWDDVDTRYPVGSVIEGKVKNLAEYGAFVEIEPGLGGLIHISDMSWTKRVNHPQEFLKKGDTVRAKILAIDSQAKKISLGMKQLEEDPWKELTKNFKEGMVLNGKVTKLVNFGVFVEIAEGVEGLVHISEIPDREKKNFQELFKVGEERKVKILRIEDDARKIALSFKAR